MTNTSKILVVLGAGLAIGGLLGVLFAPDKGSVTRQKIAEGSKKLTDKVGRKIKEGTEFLKEELKAMNRETEKEMA
jgi:gas vesicle protein